MLAPRGSFLLAAILAFAVTLPARESPATRLVDPLALPHPAVWYSAAAASSPEADSSRAGQQTPPSSTLWVAGAQEGPLWRADRLQHLTLSATLVVGAGALGAGDLEAALLAAGLGLAKEAADAAGGQGISRLDLLADLVGIGVGLLVLSAAR
jgi:hypothetical protein